MLLTLTDNPNNYKYISEMNASNRQELIGLIHTLSNNSVADSSVKHIIVIDYYVRQNRSMYPILLMHLNSILDDSTLHLIDDSMINSNEYYELMLTYLNALSNGYSNIVFESRLKSNVVDSVVKKSTENAVDTLLKHTDFIKSNWEIFIDYLRTYAIDSPYNPNIRYIDRVVFSYDLTFSIGKNNTLLVRVPAKVNSEIDYIYEVDMYGFIEYYQSLNS